MFEGLLQDQPADRAMSSNLARWREANRLRRRGKAEELQEQKRILEQLKGYRPTGKHRRQKWRQAIRQMSIHIERWE